MTEVYCMSSSTTWQQFTILPAAENDISFQYDQQLRMTSVYNMTHSKT
jgi:hypothetical protein